MTLVNPSASLGEPVVLAYRIENPNDAGGEVDLGDDWLTLALTDASGQRTTARPQSPSGGARSSGHRLSPRSGIPGQAAVSRFLDIPGPGRYTLSVKVRLPYLIAEQPGAYPRQADVGNAPTVVSREFSFPLVVEEADPRRLRALAETFRARFFAAPAAYAERLFALPAEYALSRWRAVVNDSRTSVVQRRAIRDQLKQSQTPASIDFLGWIAWRSKQPESWRKNVRLNLIILRQEGDATLKRQINDLFIKYEGRAPREDIVIGYP